MQRTLLLCGLLFTHVSHASAEDAISFNQHIRPILSNNCFHCHGPDEENREAELRLDSRDVAVTEMEVIVPGEPEESTLVDRITHSDPEERMPPPGSGKTLTEKQIELLKQWIAAGAKYEKHWSLSPPKRWDTPRTQRNNWPRNAIDAFVLARLEKEGIAPSPEAGKETLIRRVTLDLTGLPPTPAEIDHFLADKGTDAYERLVDRLLASPRYGEHKGRYWLDAARYADTYGMHFDNYRSLWPYRDWVIRAFNNNMPFDQFTIEQLAGDLLPNRTRDQQIATGFCRCHTSTNEAGSIEEEILVRNTLDRVETTSTVFLGLTMGCAACHDHKFDPLTQKDFYSLFAFFNSTVEKPLNNKKAAYLPVVRLSTTETEEQLQALDETIAQLRDQIQNKVSGIDYKDPYPLGSPSAVRSEFVWVDDALPEGASLFADPENEQWQFVSATHKPVFSGKIAASCTAHGCCQRSFRNATQSLRVGEGDKLFAYVYLDPANPPKQIMLQWCVDDWEHRAFWGQDLAPLGQANTNSRRSIGPLPESGQWVRLEVDAAHVGIVPGARVTGLSFTQFDGTAYWDRAGIVTATPQDGSYFESLARWETFVRKQDDPTPPGPIVDIIRKPAKDRSEEESETLQDYFVTHAYIHSRPIVDSHLAELADVNQQRADLDATVPTAEVMQATPERRQAFILERGEYDKKGKVVTPDVPAVLPPLAVDAPRDRLALARWLVDPEHPLTARVTVNRMWQQYFGSGLVKTSENFGSQGEPPSHPQLLDWLATEFVRTDWDIKNLHRLIVTSATYRQSSQMTEEGNQRDPENRLLARGPRFRMDAEMIRDTILAASGLLVDRVGGGSVKPYQPAGIWEAVAYSKSNTKDYVQGHGDSLYRRSMYTFWKRTAPPPTMTILDAPSRETCTVRRERTNTPLAALALMNDPQFVEAARNLAQRLITESGSTAPERIEFAYRLAVGRSPSDAEVGILIQQLKRHAKTFESDRSAAERLLNVGESKRDESLDVSELASWTIIGNIILTLDETITKG